MPDPNTGIVEVILLPLVAFFAWWYPKNYVAGGAVHKIFAGTAKA